LKYSLVRLAVVEIQGRRSRISSEDFSSPVDYGGTPAPPRYE